MDGSLGGQRGYDRGIEFLSLAFCFAAIDKCHRDSLLYLGRSKKKKVIKKKKGIKMPSLHPLFSLIINTTVN